MKPFYLLWLGLMLSFSLAPAPTSAQINKETVVVVTVDGMIDNGLATIIDRAIGEAEVNKAKGLILHINTFGGLLDAADKIRTRLLNATVPTVAFIDKNAASAGALIALACDSIFVAPGASIGAATVVEGQSGNKATEKYQSYMRGIMRATAEAKGRNPKIAEAMVDERIEIEGLVDKETLLTLSAEEALRWGIADGEFDSRDDVVSFMGWDSSQILAFEALWAESVLRFLANPVISSLLMLMMMGGLYFELQTPGVGFPGLIAAVGATLFFAPLYIMGLAQSWEIVMFFVGIVLLAAEIFVIPGFGIAGFSGITLMVFSLGAALIGNIGLDFPGIDAITRAVWTMVVTLILGVGLMASLARWVPHNNRLNKLILQDVLHADDTTDILLAEPLQTGASGVALSPLRPAGTIKIDQRKFDVVSDGDFIDKGEQVRVVSVAGNRIVVSRIG